MLFSIQKRVRSTLYRSLQAGVLVCILSGLVPLVAQTATASKEKGVLNWMRTESIAAYLGKHPGGSRPAERIVIPAAAYSGSGDAALEVAPSFEGEANVLKWTGEQGWVEWKFNVAQEGYYSLGMDYYPLPAKGLSIEFGVTIDGESPYIDARTVQFSRLWKDATDIRRNDLDNELKPRQMEAPRWLSRTFTETQGFFNKALPFYLTPGEHVLRLELAREAVALKSLYFFNEPELPAYKDVAAGYQAKGYQPTSGQVIKIQAEKAWRKSDSILVPTYDRSDAATEPSHPSKIRLNTIGQWNWKLPGTFIEWEFEAPQDGLYRLLIKGQQDYQRGMASTRKVTIDGVVPFDSLANLEFPYDMAWRMVGPGTDAEPQLVYLSKGRHVIGMEAVLGRIAPVLTAVDDLVFELNGMYRRFVMIMGASPDIYRDYQLDREMPGLVDRLLILSERFRQEGDRFEQITGQKGTEATALFRMSRMLQEFADKPEEIPARLGSFQGDISGLASWNLYRKELPVELDYIVFQSPDVPVPGATAGFLAQMAMGVQSFFASFVEDYNSIGVKEENAITVWIGSGRDQAQILKDLITDSFTPETGVKVNLNLVQGSLIEATLAGKGPEVALFTPRGQPVNLASRGALYDLKTFADFDEVTRRFAKNALVPYQYRGGVYALPITQNFHMMFYRTDVFRELNLQPPQTWDELLKIIPVLQRNNMQVGLPYQSVDAANLIDEGMGARNLFPTLMLQNRGSFYMDDDRKSGLLEPSAYNAFKQWTDFYVSYGFDLKYDFYTRFRSGQMPIGIAAYPTYNMLVAAAPEIRNQWNMLPIPGLPQPDGSIRRTEASSGSNCVIFKHVKNPEAAWKFLKWWTSADIQLQYALQVETIMGPSGRVDTANIETFKRMPWPKKEADKILAQWDNIEEVKEVPGGYYTIRMLDTAFSDVLYKNSNPRFVLSYYTQMINDEITRKRKELGLDE